jgi:hypothetical protein
MKVVVVKKLLYVVLLCGDAEKTYLLASNF